MKKRLSIFCLAVLCACALTLSACGNNAKDQDATATTEVAVEAKPLDVAAKKYLGEWKLACVQTEGITIAGDFSMMLPEGQSITIEVNKDGTASMVFIEDKCDFAWELNDDDSVTISVLGDNETAQNAIAVMGGKDTSTLVLQDDAMVMTVDSDDLSAVFTFTKDGTLAGFEALSGAEANNITSADELVGEWMLSGMSISGMTVYGSTDDLAELSGASADTSMIISEDGSGMVMGSDITWKVDENGATFTYGEDTTLAVKSLNGDLILDMTELFGSETETVMRFSR